MGLTAPSRGVPWFLGPHPQLCIIHVCLNACASKSLSRAPRWCRARPRENPARSCAVRAGSEAPAGVVAVHRGQRRRVALEHRQDHVLDVLPRHDTNCHDPVTA